MRPWICNTDKKLSLNEEGEELDETMVENESENFQTIISRIRQVAQQSAVFVSYRCCDNSCLHNIPALNLFAGWVYYQ